MAKRRHDTSPAEDYIDQLNRQADYPNPRGGYSYPFNMPFGRVISFVLLIGIVGAGSYLIFSSKMEIGTKIFSGIMLGIIFLVFFFAARDNSKGSKNK